MLKRILLLPKKLKIYYFKILKLRVRENEISLPKWSDGTAQLRT